MTGWMYILECADGSYYTGSTNDLKLRLEQHHNGEGANHTKKRLPVILKYYEEFDRIDEAFYREKQVQGWSRKKKEALMQNAPDKLHEYAKCLNETSHTNNVVSTPLNDPFSTPLNDPVSTPLNDRSRLVAERSRLVAERSRSHVPELRFPEFDGDWFETTLAQLMTFKNGVNAAKENYGFGYKFINVLDIIENDFIEHDVINDSVNISKDEFEKNIVEYGDILFQRSSETRKEVGQANVYIDKEQPATFGGFVIRGKKESDYNPYFMNYLLKTRQSRLEIMKKSGGSTRYNVGQSTLSEVIITTTIINEQQKIANFLKAIDKRIKLLKAKKDALEEYKTSIMQKLFAQEIRFKPDLSGAEGQDDGSDASTTLSTSFPEWEENTINEVATIFSGGTPKSTNKKFYNGIIPFIKSGEINQSETAQYINEDALSDSSAKLVNSGDLLMAIYGATSGEVAISKIEGAINQAVICIRGDFDKYYLHNVLKYKRNWILNKYLQGGQGNLSADIVKNLTFRFPEIDEQNKIARFLNKIDDKIDGISNSLNSLGDFKQSLLQKMFV